MCSDLLCAYTERKVRDDLRVDFPASNTNDPKAMTWPQFRHDVRNTGVCVRDEIFANGFELP